MAFPVMKLCRRPPSKKFPDACHIGTPRNARLTKRPMLMVRRRGRLAGYGLLILGHGASQALVAGSWQLLIRWCVAAFVWFEGFGWSSSTGSGLARAIQNP